MSINPNKDFRPLTAQQFHEATEKYFSYIKNPSQIWKGKSICEKARATAVVLSYITVVAPVAVKIMQEFNKRAGQVKPRPLNETNTRPLDPGADFLASGRPDAPVRNELKTPIEQLPVLPQLPPSAPTAKPAPTTATPASTAAQVTRTAAPVLNPQSKVIPPLEELKANAQEMTNLYPTLVKHLDTRLGPNPTKEAYHAELEKVVTASFQLLAKNHPLKNPPDGSSFVEFAKEHGDKFKANPSKTEHTPTEFTNLMNSFLETKIRMIKTQFPIYNLDNYNLAERSKAIKDIEQRNPNYPIQVATPFPAPSTSNKPQTAPSAVQSAPAPRTTPATPMDRDSYVQAINTLNDDFSRAATNFRVMLPLMIANKTYVPFHVKEFNYLLKNVISSSSPKSRVVYSVVERNSNSPMDANGNIRGTSGTSFPVGDISTTPSIVDYIHSLESATADMPEITSSVKAFLEENKRRANENPPQPLIKKLIIPFTLDTGSIGHAITAVIELDPNFPNNPEKVRIAVINPMGKDAAEDFQIAIANKIKETLPGSPVVYNEAIQQNLSKKDFFCGFHQILNIVELLPDEVNAFDHVKQQKLPVNDNRAQAFAKDILQPLINFTHPKNAPPNSRALFTPTAI